jgi:hypothetical protein
VQQIILTSSFLVHVVPHFITDLIKCNPEFSSAAVLREWGFVFGRCKCGVKEKKKDPGEIS